MLFLKGICDRGQLPGVKTNEPKNGKQLYYGTYIFLGLSKKRAPFQGHKKRDKQLACPFKQVKKEYYSVLTIFLVITPCGVLHLIR
ncbi:MAG: hypothetical protein JWM14_447 [Chitinophagaceae bacterium]|nr:hypothetical protein [Chitinophagaceae bacterium]